MSASNLYNLTSEELVFLVEYSDKKILWYELSDKEKQVLEKLKDDYFNNSFITQISDYCYQIVNFSIKDVLLLLLEKFAELETKSL